MEYVMRFVRLASRYEEETNSSSFNSTSEADGPRTRIGYPTTLFKEGLGGGALGHLGQLGSGLVFTDESLGLKELAANAHRIEGWRGTNSYRYYAEVNDLVSYLKMLITKIASLYAGLFHPRCTSPHPEL
jgi:hypothetical protein